MAKKSGEEGGSAVGVSDGNDTARSDDGTSSLFDIDDDAETLPVPYLPENQNNLETPDDQMSGGFVSKIRAAYPHLGVTILAILSWYAFSLGISLYNKWMFSPQHLNFAYPIIITSFHQTILFSLAAFALWLFPKFRLNYEASDGSEYVRLEENTSDSNPEKPKPEKLSYIPSPGEYLKKILPCSLASAGDIGFGNAAFRFITLSLYTMVKTSSLIFVLLWGVVFKLEKMTCRILTIVLIMTGGVCMMVWGQHDDSKSKREWFSGINLMVLGVVLVLLASCMSGLRWALTQIMLKKNRRTRNPILTMLYLSPAMAIVLFIIGICIEGFGNFIDCQVWKEKGFFMTCLLILIPGLLAFFMTLSEYVLLQCATLLTLSITGIFKELLTIFASGLIFGDKLSPINIVGLVITFTDIVCYNVYRFQQNTEAEKTGDPEIIARSRATSHEFVDIELSSIIDDHTDR